MLVELKNEEEVEEFLSHYGKKGMKWGQRRARNRELNRATKLRENKEIDAARAAFKTGKPQAQAKKNKAQYKKDKQNLGTREARRLLAKRNEQYVKDIETANTTKNGKEKTILALGVVGIIAISQLAGR